MDIGISTNKEGRRLPFVNEISRWYNASLGAAYGLPEPGTQACVLFAKALLRRLKRDAVAGTDQQTAVPDEIGEEEEEEEGKELLVMMGRECRSLREARKGKSARLKKSAGVQKSVRVSSELWKRSYVVRGKSSGGDIVAAEIDVPRQALRFRGGFSYKPYTAVFL
jgi:hypothetical protein